jgi:transcriptional regulator GlxA family with amidase domain
LEQYGRRIAADPSKGERLAGEIVERCRIAIGEPLVAGKEALSGLTAVKLGTRQALFQRLERARGFLHENDRRNVSLTELAHVAGLSQFHLARYFKLAFGDSPINYHRGLRLRVAEAVLAKAGGTVAAAAEAAGYSDAVSLTHAFQRHYGMPPQRYLAHKHKAAA